MKFIISQTLKKIKQQFMTMYKVPSSSHKPFISTLPIGEYVRLNEIKPTFRKGYTIQKTLQIFKIIRVDTKQTPTIYYLEGLEDEPIKGVFYREELIRSSLPELYHIDIIKTKQ